MNALNEIIRAESAKRKALASLHLELGYPSAQALAQAILDAAGSASPTARSSSARPAASAPRPGARPKGRKLTPEQRQQIIDALKGGMSGTQVTHQFGVSYPTVHEIKKTLGLVTARPGKGGGAKRSKKR